MKKNKFVYLLLSLGLLTGCGTTTSSEAISSLVVKGTIIINCPKFNLLTGETITLEARKINFGSASIIWSSMDENLASVDDQGNVYAKQPGTVEIKATSSLDSSVSQSVSLDITSGAEEITTYTYHEFNKISYHNDTMPTLGDSKVLVIPVAVKDYEDNATERNLSRIKKAFTAESDDITWESVASYYEKSSFGKLNLDITVADSWYECGYTPLEIQQNFALYDDGGVSVLANKAWGWYMDKYQANPSDFDADKDGWADAVWLVYSAPHMAEDKAGFEAKYPGIDVGGFWAYVFRSYVNNQEESQNQVARPRMIGWASYDFMDDFNLDGDDDIDTHTFIHETGHLLGLKDYYATYTPYESPLGCVDMMDNNVGDHNAMSKFALGWASPKVIREETTIRLKPYEEDGSFLLLPGAEFNGTAFDEYFTIEYMTPTGLNEKDYTSSYVGNGLQGYSKPGVRITHVDNRAINKQVALTHTVADFWNDPISNTAFPALTMYLDNENTLPIRQITLMQKNVDTSEHSILDQQRRYYSAIRYSDGLRQQNPDDSLFYEGEQFDLGPTSPYRALMNSQSNKFDSYYTSQSDDDIFDKKIEVLSITDEYAEIRISDYAE